MPKRLSGMDHHPDYDPSGDRLAEFDTLATTFRRDLRLNRDPGELMFDDLVLSSFLVQSDPEFLDCWASEDSLWTDLESHVFFKIRRKRHKPRDDQEA